MAVEHTSHPVFGVQFHPESILTESGHALLGSFLKTAGIPAASTVLNELAVNADGSLLQPLDGGFDQVIHW